MSSDRSLDAVILDHAVALPDQVGDLVIAAWDSDDAVTRALDGERSAPGDVDEEPAEGPHEVYLAEIAVRGFRGVGDQVRLPLVPGPGLTLVTGRNGSAKSSIAEAAEMALTGRNSRWDGKADSTRRRWQAGWRNLHAPADAAVEVAAVIAGEPATTRFCLGWPDGAEIDQRTWTAQRERGKRAAYDGLRWGTAFEVHRPFLSYTELGRLADGKPTELHDVLHRALGLERLDAARERLRAPRLRIDGERKAVKAGKDALVTALDGIDDDRAREAASALRGADPPLGRLTDLAVGTSVDGRAMRVLHALADLRVPDDAVVDAALAARAAARERLVGAAISVELDDVLSRAVAYHDRHGDGPCPVCESGVLDQERRTAIESTRSAAKAFRAARDEHDRTTRDLRRLAVAPPAVLAESTLTTDVTRAWTAWHDTEPDAMRAARQDLADALSVLHKAVADELSRLDEAWREAATRLAAWVEQARRTQDDDGYKALKKAEDWYKSISAQIRSDRMRPFAEQTIAIYRSLRQQSSVTLDGVALAGSSNQRRAELDVRIDGETTTALGVMSQGELHALGLALFLPRAQVDESPFRFIVIDDPVQAMDPSKVDGLARVLAEVARTRQVVVFTHDDRLTESLRRQDLDATIWTVVRGQRSAVTLERTEDPVSTYLDDARAITRETEIPEQLRREIAVTCCRSALEAAADAKVRRVRLSRGEPHVDVDAALRRALKTHAKLTLAVFDDESREGDLFAKIKSCCGEQGLAAVVACKKGAHGGYRGDLRELVRHTKAVADWIAR